VDGDGLFHLQSFLKRRKGVAVLTPHLGEFARLAGVDKGTLQKDRIALAKEFAARYGVILVLKDAATLVTDGVRSAVLSRPCSALGKGGSGDVLAGLLAGMLAGEGDPFELAQTAVWLHNRAAHLAAAEHSVRALQPEQIADYIDNAWMELENGNF
jgi:NAD(P)H-hydrate epimerase